MPVRPRVQGVFQALTLFDVFSFLVSKQGIDQRVYFWLGVLYVSNNALRAVSL